MSEETTEKVLDEAVESADAPEAEGKKGKKPRKPRNKKKMIATIAVVLVVVGVAGGAFWVWHNTPSFCEAICHNPQDPYNPTYYAEPGQSATDKWGNEVKDASGMLAAVHRVEADATCLSCHEPTMAEQITEGIEWATGNFYNPLSERSLTNLTRWTGASAISFCLNENCHDFTKSDLTEKTSDLARNPHAWHHEEYTCSDCHKSHRASIMVCSQCHDDSVIPEGWLSYQESRELETQYQSYDVEKMLTES